jgi:hypothetical protein
MAQSGNLKKLIGETVTLEIDCEGGPKIETTRILDVGEKSVWVANLGDYPKPIGLGMVKSVKLDLNQ